MLDEKSPVPLYYQLQEIIRSRIESGQWQPGQQLPPEAELCEEFSLSRGTVRQALADLVREGLLHRRRGKGSFVATPKISQDLMTFATGFSAYAKQVVGTELTNRNISMNVVPANNSVLEQLGMPAGSEVVEVRRVKIASGRPYFMATSFLPKDLVPGLEKEDISEGSLFEFVRDRYGIQVTMVKGWFEPVLVNEYESSILSAEKGSPAMLYQRVRYAGDKPVMMSKHIIRGDMCRLTFQVNSQTPA